MLILALLDFAVEAIVFGLYVFIYCNPKSSILISKIIPHSLDILIFSNAYFIIILNRRIRQRVLGFLGCPRKLQKRGAATPSIRSYTHSNVHITRY
ncbi:unnamed protein product [Cylicocyclus nassatus]|uniref:Uncharacterized protein n=1 Tax=Cylicocyclus nassatus TaxID=53992 RepID=A0AA36HD42_CYLNA|nr:unnamed protein product [Cylicocyclus nassatus]